jgi:hypothetical protein
MLSSFTYNSELAFSYMGAKGMLKGFLEEVIGVYDTAKHSYERKSFVISLSHMLNCPKLPGSDIQPVFKRILETIVHVLDS